MSAQDKEFSVTIGMSVRPSDQPTYADFGLRYGNMPYGHMVITEGIFAKYSEAIIAAMQPMIRELVELGIAQAEGNIVAPQVENKKSPSKRGTIR